MGDRRTETDGVQHRTAADRQHEALPVDAVLVHGLDHAVDHGHRALRFLATDDRLHQADGGHRRMGRGVGADAVRNAGMRRQHVRIHEGDQPPLEAIVRREHRPQRGIRRIERPTRERHPVPEWHRQRDVEVHR